MYPLHSYSNIYLNVLNTSNNHNMLAAGARMRRRPSVPRNPEFLRSQSVSPVENISLTLFNSVENEIPQLVNNWALDAYDRGFRVISQRSFLDTFTLYVVSRFEHVCEVVLVDHSNDRAVRAFTTHSFEDNHTEMMGNLGNGYTVPVRYVENAVFFLGKLLPYVKAVEDEIEPASALVEDKAYLIESFNRVGEKMRCYLDEHPDLNILSDPLVALVRSWPVWTESIQTHSLLNIKTLWLEEHRKLYNCLYTNPKIAKKFGQVLKLRKSTMNLLFETSILRDMVAVVRANCCYMVDGFAMAYAAGFTKSEEFSFHDDKWAKKIDKFILPDVSNVKCLDMFLSTNPSALVLQEMVTNHLLNLSRNETINTRLLGQANDIAIKSAMAVVVNSQAEIHIESYNHLEQLNFFSILTEKYGYLETEEVILNFNLCLMF
jgi:hypothetical protein